MLASLLRGSDWSKIADYLSPVLFQVVPPLAMSREIRGLISNYRDKNEFETLKQSLDSKLRQLPWQTQLFEEGSGKSVIQGDSLSFGDRLLRLYFWQILSQQAAILDFRHSSWTVTESGMALWLPAPLYIHWHPEFIAAIRKLYLGFYHNDENILEDALKAVGLSPGKAALLRHFGADQSKVTFDLSHFRSSFHDVFVACKRERSRLHTNVLALGAVLACLYEHLQKIGGSFDVRTAFLDAEKIAL